MNKYQQIPNTDLTVSRIVFGTANAGLAWEGVDASEMLDDYLEKGGNVIDTARIYSDWVKPEIGRSERVIGDWIRQRGRHDDIIIMSKCGHPLLDTMTVSRMSRPEIESDLNFSLKALSVERIDIYCYHRDDINRPVDELIESMEQFVRSGKVRYYACSNWSAERMTEADAYCSKMGYRGFILDQALYNYGTERMKPFPDKTMVTVDAGILQYHKEHPANVLASYMALSSGFFHGLDRKGPDAVADGPYCTAENLELFKKIKSIAAKYETGITEVLLGFILTRQPEMLALTGASRMEQLDAAMNTFNVDFASDVF